MCYFISFGRYSLLVPNMRTVDSENVVMTELWRIPQDKSLSCLLGDMESCDTEEIIIGENSVVPETIKNTKIISEVGNISIKKHDYREYLVNNVPEAITSDYDTDDLIEDAKNFVTASKTRLVDVEVWREIDETRRKKRLTRRERSANVSKNKMAADSDHNSSDDLAFPPFVPRQLDQLKVGYNVRVISGFNSKIQTGIIR